MLEWIEWDNEFQRTEEEEGEKAGQDSLDSRSRCK